MPRSTPIRRADAGQEGYILIWVIFLVAVFSIWLAVAVPQMAKSIQRDRELETMNRGKQYIRAVQLYYRRFHAFPPNVNALVNTNNVRFLRKKYIDPTTGKDDWRPIHFGEAKTQTLGFFGQPIAGSGSAGGSVIAGTGPSGGGTGLSSTPTGASSTTPPDSSTTTPPDSSTATPSSATGTLGGALFTSGGSGSSSSSSTGLTGQTFGGAGIIGFAPASTRASILVYKKKTHYNEWEFVYDPLTDMKTVSGNSGNIGQSAASTSTPVGSTTPTSTTTPQTSTQQ